MPSSNKSEKNIEEKYLLRISRLGLFPPERSAQAKNLPPTRQLQLVIWYMVLLRL
jgi:hypothetical protein